MINKLRRLTRRFRTPKNDFEDLLHLHDEVSLIYSAGVIAENGQAASLDTGTIIAGQYIEIESGLMNDAVCVNLRGIMKSSDSYEEALARIIETEVHEFMHWGLTSEENEELDQSHQVLFDEIIYGIMKHSGQEMYDIRSHADLPDWVYDVMTS